VSGSFQIISYLISLIIFGLSFLFLLLSWYYYNKNKDNYDENEALFYEFFVDLQDTPKARMFIPLLLLRRFVFVIIIISFSGSNPSVLFGFLLLVQMYYLIHTLSNRKYKRINMV